MTERVLETGRSLGLRSVPMRLHRLWFLLALGGCVIYTSKGSGIAANGALSFEWSFGDASAPLGCAAAGVSYVEVLIDGLPQPLGNCKDPATGIAGATVSGLGAGTHDWEIRGEGADQTILYDGSGQTDVGVGDTIVQVVLPAAPPGTGTPPSLTFLWSFGGRSCAGAGVAQVHVAIPDAVTGADVDASVPCAGSNGVDGVTVGGFAAGSYGYTLTAEGADGGYAATGTVTIGSASPVLTLDLQRD